MNKRISTYKELLEEKQRLRTLLKSQKEQVREDMQAIGERLQPVQSAISFAGKMFSRDDSNLLLNVGTNALIDAVMKNFLLAKSGWLTRTIVPFFMKNFSSHIKKKSVNRFFSWIGKKGVNGHEKQHED